MNQKYNFLNNSPKSKYQLIYPIIGNNLYFASSLKSGARKCFNDLKELDSVNSDYFTIINVDTLETFKFRISNTNPRNELAAINDTIHQNVSAINDSNKSTSLLDLNDKINNLTNRFSIIESKLKKINDYDLLNRTHNYTKYLTNKNVNTVDNTVNDAINDAINNKDVSRINKIDKGNWYDFEDSNLIDDNMLGELPNRVGNDIYKMNLKKIYREKQLKKLDNENENENENENKKCEIEDSSEKNKQDDSEYDAGCTIM
jgi:hypothetical protein